MVKISHTQLAEYTVRELEGGLSPQSIAKKLAAYLIDSRQSRDAAKVLRAIETELNRRGSTQVGITAAREISETLKHELASLLGATNPVFSEVIDRSVVGGVHARSGEKQIDLTVRNKLNQFKTEVMRSK